MPKVRLAAVSVAVGVGLATVGVTPAIAATVSGGSGGGREWPMYHGGFTHAGRAMR